ncbi:hypothetical protein OG897_27305 [Streptomyces sp. NBC_00237]|uniref:hypothetical protein n=1 Tax=Streptomyces sp. NBC_00237 TaxID=2975687 RepID=UPI00224D8F5A|nr:hypothetical protein [Streptomyces sp. NBC_00237]MCX5205151.1 hypothetical protein [Streptomyces sp. NBC_00237]
MKQTPGTRRSYLVAATALCALALTACGTTTSDGSGQTAKPQPAKAVGAAAAQKPDSEPGPAESEAALAYMMFLNKVAEPCFPDLPKEPPIPEEEGAEGEKGAAGDKGAAGNKGAAGEKGAEADTPPTSPRLLPPIPSGPPSPDELNPGSYQETEEDKKAEAKKEAGLQCVTKAHVERITKAVKGLKDPAEVKQALVKSGYLGTHVESSAVPAAGAGFSVDMRMMGSTTCLTGTVSGAAPSVRPREVLDPEAPCPRP